MVNKDFHNSVYYCVLCVGWKPRNQRNARNCKERNEMTSLLDRPITAASDDGVCRWHATKLRQTRHKI